MGRRGIPGLSLAIVEAGTVRYEAGFGFADVENGVPARPETVYRLASVSKPMTATAVLKLYEQGRLRPRRTRLALLPGLSREALAGHRASAAVPPGRCPPLSARRADGHSALLLVRRVARALPGRPAAVRARHGGPVLHLRLQPARLRGGRGRGEGLPGPAPGVGVRAGRDGEARDDDQRELIPGRAQGYVRDGDGRLRNSALDRHQLQGPGGRALRHGGGGGALRLGAGLRAAAPAGDPRPDADAAENT